MKIALMVTPFQPERVETAKQVCSYLSARGAEILIHENNRSALEGCGAFYQDFNRMMEQCDILTAVGGDGTIIHAAKHAVAFDKPVVGINSGRLGYLAAIERSELSLLENLLEGQYTIERRMMLTAKISGSINQEYNALNDVVIASGNIAKVVELSVKSDGRSVMSFSGDGVIFATPTGSTAYAYSAGGPVIDPVIECISVTPICPHTIASRTIIFSAEYRLQTQARSAGGNVFLTVDGEEGIPLQPTDQVEILKSGCQARLIKIKDEKFNDVLSRKIKNNEGR